jgi:mycothiol synthase
MTFDWRPLRESDAMAVAGLLSVVGKAAGHADEERLRRSFGDPNHDYERGSVAIFDGRALAGCGVLTLRAADDVRHDGLVHPSYRGRGLGGALLDWAERAVRPLHADRFGARPVLLRSGCASEDDAAARLHQARGYRTVRVFWSMTRDLATPVEDAPLSDGLRVAGFTPELAADALLVRNEAFRDHWGSAEISAAQWAQRLDAAGFTPEYSYLVYQGAEPLGLLLSRQQDKDLFIGLVGTRRAGRKRGIATALLARVLSRAKAAGLATASLDVDSGSLTGAVGVYERAGFTVEASRTVYEKTLPAG